MEELFFIMFIAVVVLVVVVIKLNAKNQELNNRLNRLEYNYKDVFGKAFYNYQQIKGINHKLGLTEEENRKIAETIKTPVVTSAPVRPPVQNLYDNRVSAANPYDRVNHNAVPQMNPYAARNNLSDRLANVSPVVSKQPIREPMGNIGMATMQNQKTKNAAPIQKPAADPLERLADNSSVVSQSTIQPKVHMDLADINALEKEKASVQAAKTTAEAKESISAPVIQSEVKTAPYSAKTAVNAPCISNMPESPAASAVPQSTAQPYRTQSAKKTSEPMSIERWLGTHLFNIVASLLIFIGLILFCTLGYEYITDGMKIAAMHTVSLSFTAIGGYFTKKNRSVFSLGLTGCGLGSFFIAILLTHIYFGAISDIAAFSLLLIWIMLALFLSKKLDSLMLSITAHIGMAVSVCFAFSLGFSADRIILPVVYQIASIAVIIIGNVICYKKTYRFGLFMSMALLIYSSSVMTSVFGKPGVVPLDVSTGFAIGVYAVQILAICFVSYLISVSSALLEKSEYKIKELPYAIHIINKILWSAGIIETLGGIVYIISHNIYGRSDLFYPSLAICAAAVGHMAVTLFMSEKLNFSEKLSKISLYFISVLVTVTLFIQATEREILHGVPFLFIYTCLIMAVIKYTKNKKLNHLVSFLIGCEMAYMCFYGYNAAANVVTSILYMVIIGALILLHWFSQSGESRQKRFALFKTAEYLWISASIIPINVSEFSDISLPLILTEFAVMAIIAYLCKYASEKEYTLGLVVKAEAFITIYASFIAASLAGNGSLGDVLAIKIVFIIATAALVVLYNLNFAKSSSTVLQMLAAATMSGYIISLCIGFGSKFALAYIVRDVLACMPFFFLTAVFAFAIYMYNRNVKLSFALMFPLGLDMVFMLVGGYEELCYASRNVDTLVTVNIGFVGVLHLIAVCCMLYFLWHTQPKTEDRVLYVTSLKGITYYWSMLAICVLCDVLRVRGVYGAAYPFSLSLVFIIIINIAAIWFGYGKNRTLGKENVRNSLFERVICITSTIVLYIAMINMGTRIGGNSSSIHYAIRFAMIITALGLFYVIARELMKKKNIAVQVFVCFTATLFINTVCSGISALAEIMYIYSIVSMIVALVCIIAGFVSKARGMRIYGLILIMLCVLKLVTIDISSENSMSRVLAFVVGGIVCFIISGIYNFVEKKFAYQQTVSEISE